MHPDAFAPEHVKQLPFDPPVEHRIRRLVDEQGCAELSEDGDGFSGALRGVRGDSHVKSFAPLHGGMERANGFLEGVSGSKW